MSFVSVQKMYVTWRKTVDDTVCDFTSAAYLEADEAGDKQKRRKDSVFILWQLIISRQL